MKYLFDTDTLIFWLKGNQQIETKVYSIGLEHIVETVRQKLDLLNFDETSAKLLGEIKAKLKQQGNIIVDADIMIASIALSHEHTLVTNNSKHFQRIPNLKLENWVNSV